MYTGHPQRRQTRLDRHGQPVNYRVPGVPPPFTYIVGNEMTSPKFGKAFMTGCRGPVASPQHGLREGAFAGFCTPPTWPVLRQAQREGRDWYYGDHAYYRRGKYYRITKNAYQWVATADAIKTATPARFRACHVPFESSWRKGSAVVICPNSDVYMNFHGLDAQAWTLDCVRQLGTATDRPVIVRWKATAHRRPLYHDLHDAWAVVVFSSNAAVEALAAGVPVFVLAPWASTAQMARQDLAQIEDPYYPDNREPFLWALADHQWDLDEITCGMAWKALQT